MISVPRASAGLRTALLALLALAAMGGVLRNRWAQDEPALLQQNGAIHTWSGLASGFTAPYWPPPHTGGLYRPLARSTATLQWILGGGRAWPFHLVDLLLYVTLVLALWGLGRELLTPTQAWIAAALFAVHPVHVEAVAIAVDQGELVVGIAAAIGALAFLRWRRGALSGRTASGAIAALYLVALGFKENALVIPALLAALELALPPREEGRRARWQAIAAMALLGVAWWALRCHVLGTLAGAAPAEALQGTSVGARALTMLGVAGEWLRLLVWPAHLQGDYSPWEIAPWDRWRSEQTAGLIAVLSFALALALAWRRRPAAAFGLLWVAIGLAPVSNVVLPTGILLAERTLLLPSIGVVLVIGALLPDALWASRWRTAAGSALAALLILGVIRSARRMPVFHDPLTYMAALRTDAPESWRVLAGAGIIEMESGDRAEGERLLNAANAAWPAAPRPRLLLAFYARLQGRCDEAVPYLEQALSRDPADRWTRLPLVACLLDLGAYAQASRVAGRDTVNDPVGAALRSAVTIALDAERRRLPPHTVRLAPVPGGLTLVGVQ
ncbi:MAG TPA: tetratricopeptide repeat protein [Gemmatimonadales bacterium]|nr:tetratricopeptide repeat protein [Gemmatimonadales bacterium]